MPKTFLQQNRVILTIAAVLLLLGAGLPAAHWLHQQRLHALFDDRCIDTDEDEKAWRKDRRPYYPGLKYNLTAYTGRADDAGPAAPKQEDAEKPSLLDKPEDKSVWRHAVQGMHPDWKLDATSGATKVVRLKSHSVYRARWVPRFLTITYPPDNAVFPPNLTSPFIEWNDVHNNFWQLTLSVPGEESPRRFLTDARRWRVPEGV